MKRKAMEIEKNKMERARDGKGVTGAYVPSTMSSVSVGPKSGVDLDSTPTYNRHAFPL